MSKIVAPKVLIDGFRGHVRNGTEDAEANLRIVGIEVYIDCLVKRLDRDGTSTNLVYKVLTSTEILYDGNVFDCKLLDRVKAVVLEVNW